MKLIVLGSGGSEGIPAPFCNCKVCKGRDERCRGSYLIKTKNTSFLVEISPDFRQQQLKHHFPIDYLFISHAHDDHMRGLIELRHIFLISKIKVKSIKMLISQALYKRFLVPIKNPSLKAAENELLKKQNEDMLEKEGTRYSYKSLLKKRKIIPHILQHYKKYHFDDFSIVLIKNTHGKTYSDGFLLESNNKKILYLGDANKIGEKTQALIDEEHPNLLIAHVPYFYTSSKNTKKKDHLGIETVSCINAEKILISHFSHKAGLTHKEILKEVSRYKNIIAAKDGLKLTI